MANFAKYSLTDGYIHHWLVAEPSQTESEPERVQTTVSALQQQSPKELDYFLENEENGKWQYFNSREDHWIDLSDQPGQEAWAAVDIHCKERVTAHLILSSFGPAQMWISGQQVLEIPRADASLPVQMKQEVTLEKGRNSLLLCFARADREPQILAAAVRLPEIADCLVMLPVASPMLSNRKDLEKAFAHAYLDRAVYAEKDQVTLHWQKDYPQHVKLAVQLRRGASAAMISYNPEVIAGAEAEKNICQPFEVPDGRLNVRLMPNLEMYGEKQLRIYRDIPFYSAKSRYFSAPQETIGARVDESVAYAIQRVDDFFGQMVKMAAERWKLVNFDQIDRLLKQDTRPALVEAGLVNILLRFGQAEPFPAELREKLAAHLAGFTANTASADESETKNESEGDELCLLTCRLLAAQQAANGKRTGRSRITRARKEIEAWIKQRLTSGFCDWNASAEIEKIIFALTLLVDFASDEGLQEYAGVLLDKVFFHLAVHHLRGVPASPRRRTALPHALSTRFDPLMPITRLMWGQGAPNPHLAGTAALLSVRGYRLPEIIRQIALDEVESWMHERHLDPQRGTEVNIVSYKTPDYLLSSAQDYCAGQIGLTEQPWQAALSPDALVFTSHPVRFNINEDDLPNFWCGNHSLPRVAQWKDTLMAIYALPEDDWAGFTHAYFPAHAFDEYQLSEGWAFARKGEGYLALTAAQGLEWATSGPSAFQELRSHGQANTWICHMGRQSKDGSFAAFIEKVLNAELRFSTEGAAFQPAGGDSIEFGWNGPFQVNGEEIPLGGLPHYDTPYANVELPAQQMEIQRGEDAIRLNFDE